MDAAATAIQDTNTAATDASSSLSTFESWLYMAYSDSFGSDMEDLVGSAFNPAAVRTEARRMVTEALLVSSYIRAVSGVDVDMGIGGMLAIRCYVTTVYGSTALEVNV